MSEQEKIIKGLEDISECMGSGLFQLDNETEDEMLEHGCIEMDTSEMQVCLDSAIKLLNEIKKL
tara:strand:+ start:453 stop:644 length:192 start_codon:yes stop_codon:yes gene_type:complete